MGLLIEKLPSNVFINVEWIESGQRRSEILNKDDAYRLKDAAQINPSIIIWWFQRV